MNSIMNLKEDILWSRFQVVSFHESIMTNLTRRQLSISKGQSISWIVQAMSYKAGARPEIAEYLKQVERKYSKVPNNMTPITTSIIQHTMLCLGKIIPP